jgi:prepilin-type N-terminal cleavage/methylation domain-containing protein
MPRQLESGARLARRRGLTLPELLIAILLLAIVGGGITKVMLKQQQFYKDASASAGAKRELRLGATVLPTELRSISSSGGDILTMGENEMVLHAYTGSAVICERNAVTNADKVWVPPPNLAEHTLTSFVTTPQVGDTVFLFNENLLKGAQDDQWEKRVITAVGSDPDKCLGAPYTHIALDAGKRRPWFQLNAVIPDSVKVGSVIRFSRPIRYSIYQEASKKWYLGLEEYSGGSWGSASPIAGPYAEFASGDNNPSGLQFRYYDSLGVRVTNMNNKKDVARVDVFLRTNQGPSAITERKGKAVQDSILMRVAIRNFK